MKRAWKGIFKIFLAIMIVVLLTMGIGMIISKIGKYQYRIVLEYLGIFLIGLGALSAIGGRNIMRGHGYSLSRHTVEGEDFFRKEIYVLFQGLRFAAFMAISGLIILLISVLIYNISG